MLNHLTAATFILVCSIPTVHSVAQGESGSNKESAKRPAKQRLLNGKDLKGWRIVSEFDFEKHGKIRYEKKAVVLDKGTPATGIAWKEKFPRMNYEVSLDAKRIDGQDFFCGMTFPVDAEYCTLILGGWGGNVTGLSNVDGQNADENETTSYVDFKPNRWYRIRLRVTDQKIEAWVDQQQIVNLETEGRKFSIWWEQEPVRPFGIASWYTTSGLRNIELQRLRPAKGVRRAREKANPESKPTEN